MFKNGFKNFITLSLRQKRFFNQKNALFSKQILSSNKKQLFIIKLSYYSSAAAEKHEFQAETKNLLDIVAKSLYSEKEVFIRELISNANDAMEKRRCVELSLDEKNRLNNSFELHITVDEKNKKIIFKDFGIGMDRADLISFLGTIAKSGSKNFREKINEKQSVESIIGQFGVGFYSAFVVSDKVTVQTRKIGSEKGFTWIWNGTSEYEVNENSDADFGTTIELELRSDEAEKFANVQKIIDIINKYSIFVTTPIYVNGTLINSMKALWTIDSKETTLEMHEAFFKQLAKTHHPHLINDRPQYIFQYKTDAPINICSLFYVPSRKISHLEFASNGAGNEYGVSLYNRKVLIKSHAKEILPNYFRFLIGVVDSEDIPLNLSREMLQNDYIIEKICKTLTNRVIKFFITQLNKDRIKYTDFYKGYSLFFKEGIVLEQSQATKEELAKLLLFESSNLKAGTYTTLQEYVDRMQNEQKSIYYLFASNRQLAESSPYYEMFKSQNYEVLFIYDAADELVFISMPQFQIKKLESVEQWAKSEGLSSENDQKEFLRDPLKREFAEWIKTSLGSIKATDVKSISGKPSDHPLLITVSADMGAARHMLRISEFKELEHLLFLKPIVHVNFLHPIINGLLKLQTKNPDLAKKIVEQIYDNALITAGLLKDSSQMVTRINNILGDLMKVEHSPILTP